MVLGITAWQSMQWQARPIRNAEVRPPLARHKKRPLAKWPFVIYDSCKVSSFSSSVRPLVLISRQCVVEHGYDRCYITAHDEVRTRLLTPHGDVLHAVEG